VLAGRGVRYLPHSTPLLLPDGIVFTELVNSRMVANSPENIRGSRLFSVTTYSAPLSPLGSYPEWGMWETATTVLAQADPLTG